ncbi:MAG: 50S ribosomal protein L4 [Chloroflexi bacterium]|nr:50S ribosomal protein L4 [Chloroflexota bacterium]
MEVQVKNSKGEESGVIELADFVWAAKMNGPVLHQVVNAQRANKRQGTHDTKTRSDIVASGRKLGRQKGAGRARHGDRKSPTMRGGGVAHGPHPRSYRQRIPTKVRRLALRIALSDQLRRGNVTFVEELGIAAPKTKDLADILQAVSDTERLLLITTGENEIIRKSASNLTAVEVQTADLLNPLQVTGARHLLFTQNAAQRVDEIWNAPAARPVRKTAEAQGA